MSLVTTIQGCYISPVSPAIKKCVAPKNAVGKKDVKSEVVAKKWL